MNHKQICYILEACLLASENCNQDTIISYGISEPYVEIGIKLFNYLKDKQIISVNEGEEQNAR